MQAIHIKYSDRKISHFFSIFKAKSIAKKVGATIRKPRKISCIDIIVGFWKLQSIGQFSYDKWAEQVGLIKNVTVSGQALWKRIRPELVDLLKILLNKSFKQKFDTFIDSSVFKSFKNVYIQDATHFKLPRILHEFFHGSYSRYGKSSTAKIQATFNLKRGLFSNFSLNSFTDNDQKESPEVLKKLKANDLIIRDLGYFVLNVFSKIDKKGAYFLSRLKYGIALYDVISHNRIDLKRLLEKNAGTIDMIVFVGKKEKLKCRFVAMPVPEEVKNNRIRKAKRDRNKYANHSEEYYIMLGYTFFITNVSDDVWSANAISIAYRSRWYIEILFKGWKSSLRMKNNIPEKYITKTRVEFFFYASLLMINILVLPLFLLASSFNNVNISIIKACSYVADNITKIFYSRSMGALISHLKYSCKYEVRKGRKNSLELMYINP